MHDLLTIEEIDQRFPEEWVLIDQPIVDELEQVRSGTVVFHSRDRGEVDAKTFELPIPRYFTVRFTGQRKPNAVYLLNL